MTRLAVPERMFTWLVMQHRPPGASGILRYGHTREKKGRSKRAGSKGGSRPHAPHGGTYVRVQPHNVGELLKHHKLQGVVVVEVLSHQIPRPTNSREGHGGELEGHRGATDTKQRHIALRTQA